MWKKAQGCRCTKVHLHTPGFSDPICPVTAPLWRHPPASLQQPWGRQFYAAIERHGLLSTKSNTSGFRHVCQTLKKRIILIERKIWTWDSEKQRPYKVRGVHVLCPCVQGQATLEPLINMVSHPSALEKINAPRTHYNKQQWVTARFILYIRNIYYIYERNSSTNLLPVVMQVEKQWKQSMEMSQTEGKEIILKSGVLLLFSFLHQDCSQRTCAPIAAAQQCCSHSPLGRPPGRAWPPKRVDAQEIWGMTTR